MNMEKLIEHAVVEDLKGQICLYGFDEEAEVANETVFFPKGYLESKARRVHELQDTLGLSLSGSLSLCEVTPAEWGLMKAFF